MHVPIQRVFTTVARNLGLKDFKAHIDSWIEWGFEAEKHIGGLGTLLEKDIVYKASNTQSSTTITLDVSNINDGETLTINDAVFTFKTTPTAIDQVTNPADQIVTPTTSGQANYLHNEIHIQASDNDMATEIKNKLAASYYPNVALSNYTVSTNIVTVTYKTFGYEGNSFTLSSNSNGVTLGHYKLEGGYGLIRNNQFTLPDDLVTVISISNNDAAFLQPSSAKVRRRKNEESIGWDNRYHIVGNKVNLSDNYNKSDSEIRLTYLAVPLSVEGWPMIKEGHEIAVAQYIMWQHKLIDFMNAKLPQYIIKDLESRWYYLCGQVRGRDNMPTPQELEMIGKVWNRKMPIQSLGQLTDL